MSATHTRRMALRAGVAAVGALCAPAVALALPAPVVDPDAELFRLLDRWQETQNGRAAIDAAFDVVSERAHAAYAPRPDALWSGFNDQCTQLGARPTGREMRDDGGLRAFFHSGDVEALRAAPPVRRWVVAQDDTEKPRRELDLEGEARRQEIIAAHDRWMLDRRAVEDATGYTAALEASEGGVRALNAAEDAVKLCPPRTLAGLTRKAAWVADLLMQDAGDDDLGEVFARQVAAFGGVSV